MKLKKCEICNEIKYTDTHHIKSRSKGGEDKPYNKCEVCPNCHRDIHNGVIILEGRFLSTNCKSPIDTELIWRRQKDPTITTFEPEVYLIR